MVDDDIFLKRDLATLSKAFAYSHETGREAAIKELQDVDGQACRLW